MISQSTVSFFFFCSTACTGSAQSACSSSRVVRSHLTGSSARVTSGTAPHAYSATVWLPRRQYEDGVLSAMDTDDDFGALVCMTIKKEGKPLNRGKLLLVLLGIAIALLMHRLCPCNALCTSWPKKNKKRPLRLCRKSEHCSYHGISKNQA